MIVTIQGKKAEVPQDFIPGAEKKLRKFDKYFGADANAVLKISRKRGSETVELTVNSDGIIFRAEKQADTLLNALDASMAAMERQIRKNKTRIAKKLKEGAFTLPEEAEEPVEEQTEFRIKEKTFAFRPMSAEEAILQMNMLGHNFFVFENQDTGRVNVVYLRADGDYGHIMPE